jgi:hypothetical protein
MAVYLKWNDKDYKKYYSLFIFPHPTLPVVLQLYLDYGVSKQFRFYEVGLLSGLHSIPSNPGGLTGCFLVWFLPPTCLSWEALPVTTTSIAWWIIETQTKPPFVKIPQPLGRIICIL